MRKVYSAKAVEEIVTLMNARLAEKEEEIAQLRAENKMLTQKLSETGVRSCCGANAWKDCGELDMEKILCPDKNLSLETLCRQMGLMDE